MSPTGSTLVFQAETGAFIQLNGPVGDCGANCAATYTLSNGTITCLSEPPALTPLAASGEHFPVVTADSRVVAEELAFAYECGFSCEIRGTSSAVVVRPLGGGPTQPWMTPTNSLSPFGADPANGGLITYMWIHSPVELLVVANQAEEGFVIEAPLGSAPAFSPDGAQIAYVDDEPTTKARVPASTLSRRRTVPNLTRSSSTPRRQETISIREPFTSSRGLARTSSSARTSAVSRIYIALPRTA
jgi:hypothetical protein